MEEVVWRKKGEERCERSLRAAKPAAPSPTEKKAQIRKKNKIKPN